MALHRVIVGWRRDRVPLPKRLAILRVIAGLCGSTLMIGLAVWTMQAVRPSPAASVVIDIRMPIAFLATATILLVFTSLHLEALSEARPVSRRLSGVGIGLFVCLLLAPMLAGLLMSDWSKTARGGRIENGMFLLGRHNRPPFREVSAEVFERSMWIEAVMLGVVFGWIILVIGGAALGFAVDLFRHIKPDPVTQRTRT